MRLNTNTVFFQALNTVNVDKSAKAEQLAQAQKSLNAAEIRTSEISRQPFSLCQDRNLQYAIQNVDTAKRNLSVLETRLGTSRSDVRETQADAVTCFAPVAGGYGY